MKKILIVSLMLGFALMGFSCKPEIKKKPDVDQDQENVDVSDEVDKIVNYEKVNEGDRQTGMKIGLIIYDTNRGAIEFTYKGEKVTVYSLLELASKENNFDFDIRNVDFGKYVFAIGGKQGGEDGKYWNLYLNGDLSDKGIEQLEVEPGDTIEFKFE